MLRQESDRTCDNECSKVSVAFHRVVRPCTDVCARVARLSSTYSQRPHSIINYSWRQRSTIFPRPRQRVHHLYAARLAIAHLLLVLLIVKISRLKQSCSNILCSGRGYRSGGRGISHQTCPRLQFLLYAWLAYVHVINCIIIIIAIQLRFMTIDLTVNFKFMSTNSCISSSIILPPCFVK